MDRKEFQQKVTITTVVINLLILIGGIIVFKKFIYFIGQFVLILMGVGYSYSISMWKSMWKKIIERNAEVTKINKDEAESQIEHATNLNNKIFPWVLIIGTIISFIETMFFILMSQIIG